MGVGPWGRSSPTRRGRPAISCTTCTMRQGKLSQHPATAYLLTCRHSHYTHLPKIFARCGTEIKNIKSYLPRPRPSAFHPRVLPSTSTFVPTSPASRPACWRPYFSSRPTVLASLLLQPPAQRVRVAGDPRHDGEGLHVGRPTGHLAQLRHEILPKRDHHGHRVDKAIEFRVLF